MNVGFTTRMKINRLLDRGEVTQQQVDKFQKSAVMFLMKAVEYGLRKVPLRVPLLQHAKVADLGQRLECGVDDALFFVERLGLHFSAISASLK